MLPVPLCACVQAALRNISVLVAEDNKVNQLVAMRMLKHLGIRCDVADNGAGGRCQSAGAKHYDLILMVRPLLSDLLHPLHTACCCCCWFLFPSCHVSQRDRLEVTSH